MRHYTIPTVKEYMDMKSLGDFNLVFRGDQVVDIDSKYRIRSPALREITSIHTP